jgi:hypothetical protein
MRDHGTETSPDQWRVRSGKAGGPRGLRGHCEDPVTRANRISSRRLAAPATGAANRALEALGRYRALRCGSDFVVVDPRRKEIATLSKTAIGTVYAHAVDDRYWRLCDAISLSGAPFDAIRPSGEIHANDPEPYEVWQ